MPTLKPSYLNTNVPMYIIEFFVKLATGLETYKRGVEISANNQSEC